MLVILQNSLKQTPTVSSMIRKLQNLRSEYTMGNMPVFEAAANRHVEKCMKYIADIRSDLMSLVRD
jgi:hypothetical protein